MSISIKNIKELYESHKAHIAVIGLGYVGLPLAEAMIEAGFTVTGIDTLKKKITALKIGKSYMKHFADKRIAAMNDTGRFYATDNFSALAQVNAILICVPTPLGEHQEPLLSYVENAGREIKRYLQKDQLVILESSVFPGTTTEVLKPILEKSGLKAGKDFYLGFSPEREDPGNIYFSTTTIPKLVSGDGMEAGELAVTLYKQFIKDVIPVNRPEEAEAAKLLENIFREVNIGLINELKIIFDAMGIDVWNVIEAAKTKPFGFMPFYPGPGIGGHCIPLDPYYLTWKARERDMPTRFIDLAGQINEFMPDYVINKLAFGLDQILGRGLKRSKILLVGIAYKKNIDDMRESPAIKIAEKLAQRQAQIAYYDPYIQRVPKSHHAGPLSGLESVSMQDLAKGNYDAAVIVTAHDDIDYKSLVKQMPVVVDTRNATQNLKSDHENIISA